MIPAETVSLFVVASVLLALAPGPDNIFVLTLSALQGRMAGLAVTMGLGTGLLVHTTAVAFGVAALVQASSVAFGALKLIGAFYLLFLAWQAFRAGTANLPAGASAGLSLGALYRRGVIMNLTNPKVLIFFLAYLPQFADPARGPVRGQIMVLGVIFILTALPVFAAIALSAGYLGAWLRRSAGAQKVLNRVAGTVFIGLAASLALSHA